MFTAQSFDRLRPHDTNPESWLFDFIKVTAALLPHNTLKQLNFWYIHKFKSVV